MISLVRLGDICNVRSGYAFKSDEFISNEVPVIRIGNVTVDGLIIDNNICFDNDFWESNPNYRVNLNDILIAMSGATVGKSCQNTNSNKLLLNQRVAAISCDNYMTLRYIYHAINSSRFMDYVLINSAGCAQPNISIKQLSNFSVPNKSECEQKRIVDILDKLEKLICLRKQQLSKLDELVKSRFVEMFGTIYDNKFGYDIKTLQEVCEQIKDGTHQTPTYTDDTVNGYKFLSSKDVTTGTIDWCHLKYIPKALHEELYARISPRKGDILLAKNGTTGIAAIVDRDEIFDIYVSIALLRPIEINSIYLWAAINSVETKRQFDSSLKGIGVPNLHLGEIKKAKIMVPPLELQKEFATFVEQTDKLKLEVKKSLEKLETLKKSLMQKYFG